MKDEISPVFCNGPVYAFHSAEHQIQPFSLLSAYKACLLPSPELPVFQSLQRAGYNVVPTLQLGGGPDPMAKPRPGCLLCSEVNGLLLKGVRKTGTGTGSKGQAKLCHSLSSNEECTSIFLR